MTIRFVYRPHEKITAAFIGYREVASIKREGPHSYVTRHTAVVGAAYIIDFAPTLKQAKANLAVRHDRREPRRTQHS